MSDTIIFVCGTCRKQGKRSRSQIKSKHGLCFCSRACHYAARRAGLVPRIVTRPYVVDYSAAAVAVRKQAGQRTAATRKQRNNYRHTDTTREKLAHATARAIANGKFPRVSKIEDVVAKELTAVGVAFQRQVGLRSAATGRYVACLDFLLDCGVALEVNGTFWHADPRFYPDARKHSPAQRRTVERYARKVDALRKAGLQLVEVWEADLRKDATRAVSESLRRIAG